MADDNNNDIHREYRGRPGDPTALTLSAIASARRETERLFDLKIENVREDIRRVQRQIENLDAKIDVLRERINDIVRKNWSIVGAYIVGAVGIVSLIVSAIYHGSH